MLNQLCRLKQAGIIPDVLDDFVPSCSLHVAYTSSHKVVRLGSKIKPSHTKKAPVVHVSCPDIKEVKSFTVALTDPDAPSRKDPEWSEMCHWIVIVPVAGGALLDDETFSEERHKGPKEIVECMSSLYFPSPSIFLASPNRLRCTEP